MQGWRKRMEDSHICDLNIKPGVHLFGVFDGHGGKEVAQFVKKHFTEELLINQNFETGNLRKALIETFLKMDELLLTSNGIKELKEENRLSKEEEERLNRNVASRQNELYYQLINKVTNEDNIALSTGCTATVCLINQNKMYFANAGDSRIIICKKGQVKPMTIDHKPELDSEKNRIYKAEGYVTEGRVKGGLNLSRSLGDMEYKQNTKLKPEEQMITAFPDITEESIQDVDFIVLGCDGIWDCKSNQDTASFIKKRLDDNSQIKLSSIIEELMDEIIAPDLFIEPAIGCDNMTCTIVQLKK